MINYFFQTSLITSYNNHPFKFSSINLSPESFFPAYIQPKKSPFSTNSAC